MAINRKLLNALTTRAIPISEFLEKSQHLDNVTGEERTKLQEKLAEDIEATYPLKKKYQTEK